MCEWFHDSKVAPDERAVRIRWAAEDAGRMVGVMLREALDNERKQCTWLSTIVIEQHANDTILQGLHDSTVRGLMLAGEMFERRFCCAVDEFIEAVNIPRRNRHFGPPKSLGRIVEKLAKSGGQLSICDMNRVEIVCETHEQLNMCVANITLIGHIARIKNKFLGPWKNVNEPPCVFYNLLLKNLPVAHQHLLLDPSRWVVEVQITTPAFLAIKQQCHAVYEISRVVDLPERCPVCRGF